MMIKFRSTVQRFRDDGLVHSISLNFFQNVLSAPGETNLVRACSFDPTGKA
jgi:hypothetical protein